jgi:hypothetical protein
LILRVTNRKSASLSPRLSILLSHVVYNPAPDARRCGPTQAAAAGQAKARKREFDLAIARQKKAFFVQWIAEGKRNWAKNQRWATPCATLYAPICPFPVGFRMSSSVLPFKTHIQDTIASGTEATAVSFPAPWRLICRQHIANFRRLLSYELCLRERRRILRENARIEHRGQGIKVSGQPEAES